MNREPPYLISSSIQENAGACKRVAAKRGEGAAEKRLSFAASACIISNCLYGAFCAAEILDTTEEHRFD